MIRRLGPAEADGAAERRDLTQGALGLALELDLAEPVVISPRRPRPDGAGRVGDAPGLHPEPPRRPPRRRPRAPDRRR